MSDASSKPATKLRLALIGCGRIGRLHAERVAADGRAVLTALLDPDLTAAKSLCSEVAEAAVVYPTFESLVEGAEFDAAVVASPTHLHFEQASAPCWIARLLFCAKSRLPGREGNPRSD